MTVLPDQSKQVWCLFSCIDRVYIHVFTCAVVMCLSEAVILSNGGPWNRTLFIISVHFCFPQLSSSRHYFKSVCLPHQEKAIMHFVPFLIYYFWIPASMMAKACYPQHTATLSITTLLLSLKQWHNNNTINTTNYTVCDLLILCNKYH